MSDKRVSVTVGQLRKIISEAIREVSLPAKKGKPEQKDPTEQRAVIDKVREAISDAVTENVRERIRNRLSTDVISYSDIEIISEPPKTLVRLKNVDNKLDHDMIYLINVTKIV